MLNQQGKNQYFSLKNVLGDNALHNAVNGENLEIVKLLVKKTKHCHFKVYIFKNDKGLGWVK